MNIVAKADLNFHGIALQPAPNVNGIWLTSADIAKALGYASSKSVSTIYSRNSDEFTDSMSMVIKMMTNGINNNLREKSVRVFSLRGCHLVAMFATTDKAKEFRRWVLNVLDREVAQGNVNPEFDFDFRMHSVNSNALCVLLTQSREIFRKDLEPALRLIDSPMAGKICGRLTDACAIAHSINKALERNVNKEGVLLQ
jgi:hypothetical protein